MVVTSFAEDKNGQERASISRDALVDRARTNPPDMQMRILMVTPRFLPYTGGVENHVYEVGRRLVGKGVSVTVLTTDPTGELPECEIIDGIRVERVRAWPKDQDLYFAPGLVRAIRRGAWDLMHIQSYHTFVPPLAMAVAQILDIPYVVTFHGGGHSSKVRCLIRPIQRAALRPLLRRAERLVALASFEIQLYGSELGMGSQKFVLIPNGCEFPQPPSMPVKRPNSMIASIGRLERYKGHHRAISAMPYILKEKPDAHLWIAGSGPYENELLCLARRLGVQDHVKIQAIPPQERAAMAEELSKASLVVLLSEFETHPISVLEGLSLGVPALVTDTSGLSELANLGAAQSIPVDSDDRQVAQAILEQLDHPRIPRLPLLPTWDLCAQNLLNLYQSILCRSEGRPPCGF